MAVRVTHKFGTTYVASSRKHCPGCGERSLWYEAGSEEDHTREYRCPCGAAFMIRRSTHNIELGEAVKAMYAPIDKEKPKAMLTIQGLDLPPHPAAALKLLLLHPRVGGWSESHLDIRSFERAALWAPESTTDGWGFVEPRSANDLMDHVVGPLLGMIPARRTWVSDPGHWRLEAGGPKDIQPGEHSIPPEGS